MEYGSMTLQEAVNLIDLLGGKEAVKKVLAGREFSPVKYGELTLGRLEAILNKLGGIEEAKALLRGELELVQKKHLIDCDAQPFIPEGWKVVEHQNNGQFEWDLDRVELYLEEKQKEGGIQVSELRKKLSGMPVMNANVLYYLHRHSELIPHEWKGKCIFFWGTIYQDQHGLPVVLDLNWYRGKWCWHFCWFEDILQSASPALVLRK